MFIVWESVCKEKNINKMGRSYDWSQSWGIYRQGPILLLLTKNLFSYFMQIYANLAILATLLALLVTRCMSWILLGLVAF